VEIGIDEGGTLLLWTRVATEDALLVALDIRPLGVLGRWSAWAFLRRGFARARQRVELLMPTDSHTPATLDRLRATLGGRPVDFMFIDGDHSYDGVKRDFEMYSPLVRPGGLVAFHDVVAVGAPGVIRFWNELKQTHETEECAAAIPDPYGIGVCRIPPPD
jgi:cephalosporin hydroxylase